MVTRLVYNGKAYKIIDSYEVKSSNNEVTFNDIVIDFTGRSIADIPYKYQEIKVMRAETENDILSGEIIFAGYLDEIKLSEMKKREEFREMTLTLLSPLKVSTVRTVTLIGTYNIQTAIERVLEPLINDGFEITEINIPEGEISTNFVLETIENCMNIICSQKNIFWFINEKKEILINSIDYLFGRTAVKKIDKDEKVEGFLKIQPTIENIDYANVINFKNVRLIYSQQNSTLNSQYPEAYGYPIVKVNKVIKQGDMVTFDNPIIIDEKTLRTAIEDNGITNRPAYNFSLTLKLANGNYKAYSISLSVVKGSSDYNKYIKTGSITFSDANGSEGEIVLQRDNFFSNLITGFKWNYTSNATIEEIQSDTALRYTTMRFMYAEEINKLKGVISESGQIEKTVDFNEKWTTLTNLIAYARSLIVQNSNIVNQVELEFDINPELKIGDIITINEPHFFTEGNFVVKEISYNYKNELEQNWRILARTTALVSTYIDLFRPQEKEESEETVNSIILTEFVEEKMNETHSIEEV